jgi:hypothetical protein
LDGPSPFADFMNDVWGGPPGGTGGTPSPRARLRNDFAAVFGADLRAAFFAGFRAEDFLAADFFFGALFLAALFLRVAGRLAAFRRGFDLFVLFFLAGARFAAFFLLAGAFLRAAFFADFRPFFAAIGHSVIKGLLCRDYWPIVKRIEPASEARPHVTGTGPFRRVRAQLQTGLKIEQVNDRP